MEGGEVYPPAEERFAPSVGKIGGPAPKDLPWTEKVELGLFYIKSADDAFSLYIKGRLQVDGAFVLDEDREAFDNSFQIRRARIEFVGHVHERLEYNIGLEFGRTSDADLRNAFLELRVSDELRIRAGQQLLPYSTVRLTSSKYLNHPERTMLIGNIVEERDTGVMVHGQLGELARYYLGVFNGNGQNERFDTDDDFDLATRLELQPAPFLLLTANYIYSPPDREQQRLVDFRTVGNAFSTFLDYLPGVQTRGKRHRVGGGFKLMFGPFELKAEVDADHHQEVVSPAGRRADLTNWSYYVDLAYVLTGEDIQQKDDGGVVVPDAPLYDTHTKQWGPGAWQLAVRFEDLYLDDATVRRGFAVGSDQARAVTTTLHWYLWKEVRFSVAYTYTHFEDGYRDPDGDRVIDENAILTRFAVFF